MEIKKILCERIKSGKNSLISLELLRKIVDNLSDFPINQKQTKIPALVISHDSIDSRQSPAEGLSS